MEWRIIRLTEVSSTNDYAREIAEDVPEGTVVVAKRQTSGRGRKGRNWASPEGGLWMTAILKPRSSPEHVPKLVFIGALAVVDTLARYGIPAEIKWPNDVLVDGRKIAGILSECKLNSFALLGIGLNVNNRVPEELRDSAVSMAELLGGEPEVERVLDALLRSLSYWYSLFKSGRHGEILRSVRTRSAVIGKDVVILEDGEIVIRGRAVGIDDSGALLVDTGESVERVLYGDVSLRFP
ncbi:biotin--[acetyl-CoA-carboxylase] ligase [Thermococcus sp. 21S9]|uniref:biotin--[acetyl-CoA-carboxylase] ligase n=1 Tax=Thermococcus sp. 21S9 TaxID=1638223 RepID=UPI001438B546|nr:biotin--[acetyl-CoA-carboxylase] ligase [Thermococcus sp. 21S9]NJE53657.1 biotin--[acetyl-CoA-carboxylase] ligase [Thermococcus sp. 21S9]